MTLFLVLVLNALILCDQNNFTEDAEKRIVSLTMVTTSKGEPAAATPTPASTDIATATTTTDETVAAIPSENAPPTE